MKKIASIFALVNVLSIQVMYAQQHLTKSEKEEKVRSLIASLPEIIDDDHYIVKRTNGRRHLETYIDAEPTKGNNRYRVTVAEYNGMNMVPHFRFIVEARTYSIFYWDVIPDRLIPLAKWRKNLLKSKRVN
jgi:hypothetical protein